MPNPEGLPSLRRIESTTATFELIVGQRLPAFRGRGASDTVLGNIGRLFCWAAVPDQPKGATSILRHKQRKLAKPPIDDLHRRYCPFANAVSKCLQLEWWDASRSSELRLCGQAARGRSSETNKSGDSPVAANAIFSPSDPRPALLEP